MRQVTKERFFAVINPLDVVVTIVGEDYNSDFKFRNGKRVGSIEKVKSKRYKPDREYFLEDEFCDA